MEEPSKAPPSSDPYRFWPYAFIIFFPLATLVTALYYYCSHDRRPVPAFVEATIRAALTPPPDEASGSTDDTALIIKPGGILQLEGIVSVLGEPAPGVPVSIAALSDRGVSLYQGTKRTDETGHFKFEQLQLAFASITASVIEISTAFSADRVKIEGYDIREAHRRECARVGMTDNPRCFLVTGELALATQSGSPLWRGDVYIPRWALSLALGTFITGVFAAVFGRRRLGRIASIASEVSVALFALCMLGIIASAYAVVLNNGFASAGTIQTSIGYLTYGTFHQAAPPDWIYSLSYPQRITEAATQSESIICFGAPLWAILISTFGSCIIAFQYLVRASSLYEEQPGDRVKGVIVKNVEDRNVKDVLVKERADQLFAIAFSPIGAIFVYQALLSLDMTGYVVPGTVLLASGLSVGTLVSIGSRQVIAVISRATSSNESPEKKDQGKGQ